MVLKEWVILEDTISKLDDLIDFSPLFTFKEPKESLHFLLHIFPKKITFEEHEIKLPRHIIFLNIQCLRCGHCCNAYEAPDVVGNLSNELLENEEFELLDIIDQYTDAGGEVLSDEKGVCLACKKVKNKPYYYCKLNKYKSYLTTCEDYICKKSIPVSNINYFNVDELINKIGIKEYNKLIKKHWEGDFE